MSKYDIGPQFECQNSILNVKIRYSATVLMSKLDFECQNTILGPISNVKIGLQCQNTIFGLFECQNRILNVKIRYSAQFRMSK